MGIPGLTRYAKRNVTPERVNLTARAQELDQTITLAVDVSALAYHLACNRRAIPYHTGGCYQELANATISFVTSLRVRGIEIRGIVDGLTHWDEKSMTTLSRLYVALNDKKEAMRQFNTYGRQAALFQERGPFIKPPLMHETVLAALKQCNVPLIRAQREADDLLAHSARPDGGSCHAILSNDSDFLVYDTGPLILFDDITIADPNEEFPQGYMVVRMYSRNIVASALGVAPSLMPVVASLVGTDSTPPKQEIHHRLSAVNRSKGRKSYNKADVVVQAGRYVQDFTKSHPNLHPTEDSSYDEALASSLFGTVLPKSSGKRGGGGGSGSSSNKKKKNKNGNKKRGGHHEGAKVVAGKSLVSYLHSGRTRYNMSMSMEEWNSHLSPKQWSAFHNCEYDRNLTEILVDQHYTWGRPPLESLDSYMLCLPLRERLYTHLFGQIMTTTKKNTNNPQENDNGDGNAAGNSNNGNGNGGDDDDDDDGDIKMMMDSTTTTTPIITNKDTLMSMVTSFADGSTASTSSSDDAVSEGSRKKIMEHRLVRKKKTAKPTPVQIMDKEVDLDVDTALYGFHHKQADIWLPSKEKYHGSLPTIICSVLSTIVSKNVQLKHKINEAFYSHVHRLMTRSEKNNLKKVDKNPCALNYVERLSLYTLIQVIYIHVRMILLAFDKNLQFGPLSTSPQHIFGHFPMYVNGSSALEEESSKQKTKGWKWTELKKEVEVDAMEVDDL